MLSKNNMPRLTSRLATPRAGFGRSPAPTREYRIVAGVRMHSWTGGHSEGSRSEHGDAYPDHAMEGPGQPGRRSAAVVTAAGVRPVAGGGAAVAVARDLPGAGAVRHHRRGQGRRPRPVPGHRRRRRRVDCPAGPARRRRDPGPAARRRVAPPGARRRHGADRLGGGRRRQGRRGRARPARRPAAAARSVPPLGAADRAGRPTQGRPGLAPPRRRRGRGGREAAWARPTPSPRPSPGAKGPSASSSATTRPTAAWSPCRPAASGPWWTWRRTSRR